MAGDDKTPTRGLDKAYDSMKHITTLCTGIIGLTVTFAKEFKPDAATLSVPASLKIGWICYGVSLFFALWALLAITGSLNKLDTGPDREDGVAWNDAMRSNVRIPSALSILAFVAAIGFTIHAGAAIAR